MPTGEEYAKMKAEDAKEAAREAAERATKGAGEARAEEPTLAGEFVASALCKLQHAFLFSLPRLSCVLKRGFTVQPFLPPRTAAHRRQALRRKGIDQVGTRPDRRGER